LQQLFTLVNESFYLLYTMKETVAISWIIGHTKLIYLLLAYGHCFFIIFFLYLSSSVLRFSPFVVPTLSAKVVLAFHQYGRPDLLSWATEHLHSRTIWFRMNWAPNKTSVNPIIPTQYIPTRSHIYVISTIELRIWTYGSLSDLMYFIRKACGPW
jgi:hypothetical protein